MSEIKMPRTATLDFTKLIEEKQRAHFAGTREWLFDAVKQWLLSSNNRLFWVVGDAGTGKSVISAKLLQLEGIKEHVMAWHFCRHDNVAMSAVDVMLMSWAAMLSKNLPGFKEASNVGLNVTASVEELFKQLIGNPLLRMRAPLTPCVIVLDALDELPKEALSPVLNLIANVFESLPSFVRLFVTSRNQRDIVKRLEKFGNEKLLVDEVRNKADLRAYLSHIAREHVDLEITTSALEHMLEHEFGLAEATLNGKLTELESLIIQSKYIYQEAVREYKALPEYHEICKMRDIEPNPAPMQTAESMEALYPDASLAHAKLVSAFAQGKKEHWVDIIVDPGLKALDSALRKVRDEYKGNFRLLKDITRFTAEFLSCYPMNDFLEKLRSQSRDFEFVALRNKHRNPTALGYRDFNITLLVKLEGDRSHLCELQVNLSSMLAAKHKAHLHYEKIRVYIPHICAAANITETGRFEASLVRILNSSMLDSAVAELELKAGGLFLYATLLAHQLKQDENMQHVSRLDFSKLYALPSGLNEIYQENFDRLVGADKTQWRVFVPVIALIVATREPLAQTLAEAVLATDLNDVQSSLSVLFPVREGCFQVMHKSVVDWLRGGSAGIYTIGAEDLKIAHAAMGQYLLKCCGPNKTNAAFHAFAGRQVMFHLCEAGLIDEVYGLVSDLNWLLMRAESTSAGLLADCELAVKCNGPHQVFCKLVYSALKNSLQAWIGDYQCIPAQLVGRLMRYEADAEMARFLKQVRNWSGPSEGWWYPITQTLSAAGGPQLSEFKYPVESSYSMGPSVNQLDWNLDETAVVYGDSESVKLLDVTTGKLSTFKGHKDMVIWTSWSSDSKRVCSGSDDTTVRVWDVESEECVKVFKGHTARVTTVRWSNDNKRICSASWDKTVRVWDVESGECIKTFEGHTDYVNAVQWLGDNKRVCSGSQDKTVRVWNVESGECIKTIEHTSQVNKLSCSNDGKRASCIISRNVLIFDVESGETIQTLEGHSEVFSMSWSNDDKKMCSGSHDNAIRIWDVESGKCVKTFEGHTSVVISLSWSIDGKGVRSASYDRTVRIWDAESGESIKVVKPHNANIRFVRWSYDGKKVCSGDSDGVICVWDVKSGECIRTIKAHKYSVYALSWSSDNKRVCSGSYREGIVRVWDVESGECKTFEGHEVEESVNSLSWSSDNNRVCSGSEDETMRVWDVESSECLKVLKHTGTVKIVSWSSDNKRACSASSGSRSVVHIWDVESGECIRQVNFSMMCSIVSVKWSSDNRKVCIGSRNRPVQVWDIGDGFCFPTLRWGDTGFLESKPVEDVPLKFGVLDVKIHPLNSSRAVAISHVVLHFMCRVGTSHKETMVLGIDGPQKGDSANECKTPQSGAQCPGQCMTMDDKSQGGSCLECLQRAWCLINLVELPPDVQEEEVAARRV